MIEDKWFLFFIFYTHKYHTDLHRWQCNWAREFASSVLNKYYFHMQKKLFIYFNISLYNTSFIKYSILISQHIKIFQIKLLRNKKKNYKAQHNTTIHKHSPATTIHKHRPLPPTTHQPPAPQTHHHPILLKKIPNQTKTTIKNKKILTKEEQSVSF